MKLTPLILKILAESDSKELRMVFLNHISEFRFWYRKYQRDGSDVIPDRLMTLVGNPNMFDSAKDYTLYRGLYFKKPYFEKDFESNNDHNKIKQMVRGNVFPSKSLSWTFDIDIARGFAMGSTHYLDRTKLKDGDVGLVLKYKFSHSNIFADINYLQEQRILSADFEEDEVLVNPILVQSRIVEKITK